MMTAFNNNISIHFIDRIFRYEGIIPFEKKTNGLVELEYKEMVETKKEIGYDDE